MPSLLKESLGKPCLMFRPVWFLELELWELQVSVQCPWPGSLSVACPRSPTLVLLPQHSPTPAVGPRFLGLPGAPRGSSITPAVQMRTAGCALSWSFPGLPTLAQERAFMDPTPFSRHHSTLPALLGGGGEGGLRNGQAQGNTHSPIVWVPPPAPWDFGQVAHPLTRIGEGGY